MAHSGAAARTAFAPDQNGAGLELVQPALRQQ